MLNLPDGIEPPANFSEQVKHLIEMIEEDDEAEVTEETRHSLSMKSKQKSYREMRSTQISGTGA
jgi:hypothetical protein